MSPKTEMKINYSDEKYTFNISDDDSEFNSETEDRTDYDYDSVVYMSHNTASDYDIYRDSPPPIKKRRLYCPKYVSIIGESAIERRFVVLKKVRKSTDSVPETESESEDDTNVWVDNNSPIQKVVVEFHDIEKQEKELDNFTVVSHKKKPVPPPPVHIPSPPVQKINNKFSTACNKLDKCKMGKACHFAHSIEQLTPFECKFGAKCKNGSKCTFKHRAETKEQYVNRLGIKFN